MQPSILWGSSVSFFVIERTAIIHSLKCTVPFSLVAPLLSLAVTYCYLLSLVVTRCITPCHSLSLVVIHCHSLYHSLSLVVPLVVVRCHSLPLVVPIVVIRCHSLSLDVLLVCLFINYHIKLNLCVKLYRKNYNKLFNWKSYTKLLIKKNTQYWKKIHQTQSWNILDRNFILKKLHHIQKKLHAKLKILHQITKPLHQI